MLKLSSAFCEPFYLMHKKFFGGIHFIKNCQDAPYKTAEKNQMPFIVSV